jgi:outer membrane lipoprotein SlyB
VLVSKKSKRKRALARRYGHFNMGDVNKASGAVKRFTHDHPLVAGAAMGAAATAVTAGSSPATAALVGAIAGVAAQEATKR